jgi:hypothetical protein
MNNNSYQIVKHPPHGKKCGQINGSDNIYYVNQHKGNCPEAGVFPGGFS